MTKKQIREWLKNKLRNELEEGHRKIFILMYGRAPFLADMYLEEVVDRMEDKKLKLAKQQCQQSLNKLYESKK